MLISISYFLGFPCLDDDLTELVALSFFFFLSFFIFSDETSGEAAAGLLTGSDTLEKRLEQGGFSTVATSSVSASSTSDPSEESEPEQEDSTRPWDSCLTDV